MTVTHLKMKHEEHLRQVFERLDKHGLVINVSKSIFGPEEIEFLGYSVFAAGIKPPFSTVQDVFGFEKPRTVKAL